MAYVQHPYGGLRNATPTRTTEHGRGPDGAGRRSVRASDEQFNSVPREPAGNERTPSQHRAAVAYGSSPHERHRAPAENGSVRRDKVVPETSGISPAVGYRSANSILGNDRDRVSQGNQKLLPRHPRAEVANTALWAFCALLVGIATVRIVDADIDDVVSQPRYVANEIAR